MITMRGAIAKSLRDSVAYFGYFHSTADEKGLETRFQILASSQGKRCGMRCQAGTIVTCRSAFTSITAIHQES